MTVITTLDSEMLDDWHLTPQTQALLGGAVTVLSAAAVWWLRRAGDAREVERVRAFSGVLKAGNELVTRCGHEPPEGTDKRVRHAQLHAEWEAWDATGYALVQRWGSEADLETYSADNPTNGLTRDLLAANVRERLRRLEVILRSR